MSRKIPPETRTYSSGGGSGSRLVIRTRCSSPTAPDSTASWTERCAGSKRRLRPSWRNDPALHGGERAVDLGELERDRLLEEERLARRRRRDDEVDVGVGARADRDRVDVWPLDQLRLDARDRDAELVCDGLGRPSVGVVHGGQREAGHLASRAARRACARSGRHRGRRPGSGQALTSRPAACACRRRGGRARRGPRRVSHLGHADLPERAARRPVVRRRPDDDDGRAVGGARPLERLLELVDRRDRLRQAADRRGVRDEVDGRTSPAVDVLEQVVVRRAALVDLEPVDDRVAAVVAHDHDQLVAREHRAVELGVHHQVRAVADERDHLAVGRALRAPTRPRSRSPCTSSRTRSRTCRRPSLASSRSARPGGRRRPSARSRRRLARRLIAPTTCA